MPRVGVNCRFGLVAERLALLSVTHAFEESEGCQAMRSRVRPDYGYFSCWSLLIMIKYFGVPEYPFLSLES